MRRAVLLVVLAAAIAVPATAVAKSMVGLVDVVPSGRSASVTFTTHRAAAFTVSMRVPTQGRARLYLKGKTAPKGGPLIDTKTYDCQGAAGSFICRAGYERLPKGTYTWRLHWVGQPAKPAQVELTVRW